MAPERLLALRRVATIESIGSSTRIEGSKLSDRDVEALLAGLETKSFATRDEQEVAGYVEVMVLLFSSWEHIPFNENHITQLHRDLLAHSTKDERHRGAYKTSSNSVAAFDEAGHQVAVIFEAATPFDTPRLMQELVEWVRNMRDNESLHPLLMVAVFVVVFFGNSSVSRRQWSALAHSHDPSASLGWLHLCALPFTGKHHRAKQARLLQGVASNTKHHPH